MVNPHKRLAAIKIEPCQHLGTQSNEIEPLRDPIHDTVTPNNTKEVVCWAEGKGCLVCY